MSRPDRGWLGLAAATAGAAVLGAMTLGGALSLALAQTPQENKQKPERERFTAFAVNMGTVGSPRGRNSGTVDIIIDRWSTEEERQKLIKAFEEKGADGLVSALHKIKRLGTLRTPDTLGWELYYAVQVPLPDGGRRILLGTDRYIGYFEASNQTRTTDYPFTLVELRLDKDGVGEGKLALATKISKSKDGKQIELENYSSEPVRLTKVRQQKKK